MQGDPQRMRHYGINTACFLKFMVRLYPAAVNLIISSVNHEIIHRKTIFKGEDLKDCKGKMKGGIG